MLTGKTVLLGVTGGIAAYKAAYLASALVKLHAQVDVVMTKNAAEFIAPLTFEHLTARKAYTDTFDRFTVNEVEHIALADRADLVEAVVVGTVVGDAMFAALRRMAQVDASSRLFAGERQE